MNLIITLADGFIRPIHLLSGCSNNSICCNSGHRARRRPRQPHARTLAVGPNLLAARAAAAATAAAEISARRLQWARKLFPLSQAEHC